MKTMWNFSYFFFFFRKHLYFWKFLFDIWLVSCSLPTDQELEASTPFESAFQIFMTSVPETKKNEEAEFHKK